MAAWKVRWIRGKQTEEPLEWWKTTALTHFLQSTTVLYRLELSRSSGGVHLCRGLWEWVDNRWEAVMCSEWVDIEWSGEASVEWFHYFWRLAAGSCVSLIIISWKGVRYWHCLGVDRWMEWWQWEELTDGLYPETIPTRQNNVSLSPSSSSSGGRLIWVKRWIVWKKKK